MVSAVGALAKYPQYYRLVISLECQRWSLDEGSPREAALEISMESPRGTLTGFCRRRLARHMEPMSQCFQKYKIESEIHDWRFALEGR